MNSGTSNNRWHHRRRRAERRFRFYGQCALGLAMLMLVILVGSIVMRGASGFVQTQLRLAVMFDPTLLGLPPGSDAGDVPISNYQRLAQASLKAAFPGVVDRREGRDLSNLISLNAGAVLKRALVKEPELLGRTKNLWLPVASAADLYVKGGWPAHTPGGYNGLSDRQMEWLRALREKGAIRTAFNRAFFTQGDSRAPEHAGFLGAMLGSAFTLIVCLLVAFPLGVMTAVYLEEFARKSALAGLIEVNINNLAAVPSIVFGLLGLAVYINVMGLPRSSALVGGMTLALMILPVIIIATRAALSSVPASIRDAARALGASPIQVVWHHALPLSLPGIMTGTILGMARAIGETAPLLMIGMVAFVADTPTGFTSPATVMPVQIYLWASSPEPGFAEKTAAGIIVLLVLLLAMNALAIFLRKRFEVRW